MPDTRPTCPHQSHMNIKYDLVRTQNICQFIQNTSIDLVEQKRANLHKFTEKELHCIRKQICDFNEESFFFESLNY